MNKKKQTWKKFYKGRIKKHLFLIIFLVIFIILIVTFIYTTRGKTIINNMTDSFISKNKETVEPVITTTMEIPVEDDVIDPPPAPTD